MKTRTLISLGIVGSVLVVTLMELLAILLKDFLQLLGHLSCAVVHSDRNNAGVAAASAKGCGPKGSIAWLSFAHTETTIFFVMQALVVTGSIIGIILIISAITNRIDRPRQPSNMFHDLATTRVIERDS